MGGVRRLVFVSTIKVNGDYTGEPGLPDCFTAEDAPSPTGAYAVSKYEAEQRLRELCDANGMELCIVRPPLVYGPGAGGNFRRLAQLVKTGVPLPFAAIDNRRSMLALDNLVSLLRLCAASEAAPGRVFLASDGHDVSTPELIREIAKALGHPARLVRTPPKLLEALAGLLGRREEMQRLCRSLQVDNAETCQQLGWAPPISFATAIRSSVAGL
jgi:UDP-glucose 4-epimerase